MEESLLPKRIEQSTEQQRVTWKSFSEEMKRICHIAGPMVAVISSQYLLQVVSTMMVGHLGELYLSSAALAFSLASVTGFSLLVSYSILTHHSPLHLVMCSNLILYQCFLSKYIARLLMRLWVSLGFVFFFPFIFFYYVVSHTS